MPGQRRDKELLSAEKWGKPAAGFVGVCPTLGLLQPGEQSPPWCPDMHQLCVELPGDHPGILDLFAEGTALAGPWLCSLGALHSSTPGSAVQFGALVWGKLLCLGLMRVPCSQSPVPRSCPSAAVSSGLWLGSQRSLPWEWALSPFLSLSLPWQLGSCQESGVESLGHPPWWGEGSGLGAWGQQRASPECDSTRVPMG